MDPVTIIMVAATVLGLLCYQSLNIYLNKRDKDNIARSFQKLMKTPQDNSWDDEWLSAEDQRHRVTAIVPKKLYLFGDITKPVTDGFQWTCACSGKGIGINLNIANLTFEKHKKEELEKALAAIGRFK